ncbi:hypothetical protein HDV06_000910 [Boothiomyces sp. JEL0866]|nr:hypothetical protein HDV06_000910 [Boothiomyces sp. JEL0866]
MRDNFELAVLESRNQWNIFVNETLQTINIFEQLEAETRDYSEISDIILPSVDESQEFSFKERDLDNETEIPSYTEADYQESNGDLQHSESQQYNDEESELFSMSQKLVSTLFPKLAEKRTEKEPDQSEYFLEKINQLELDLSKSKQLLMKARRESEAANKREEKLKDNEIFYLNEEIRKLKVSVDLEMKKFKKEKILWEKQRKAMEILPTKRSEAVNYRERQEVEMLRIQLQEEREKFKQAEGRLQLAQERMRKKNDDLEKRNRELLEEVKTLEQERSNFLELKKSVTASKEDRFMEDFKPIEVRTRTSLPLAKSKRPSLLKQAARLSLGSAEVKTLKKTFSMPALNIKVPKKNIIRAPTEGEQKLDELEKKLEMKPHVHQTESKDGQIERFYPDKTRCIWHSGESIELVKPDGMTTTFFNNGDKKIVDADKTETYWFKQSKIKQTTRPDGETLYEFDNGQKERKLTDGTYIIEFTDNTVKTVYPDKSEKIIYPDGKYQETDPDGRKIIKLPEGTIEIHENGRKEKIYTNGGRRITYPSGIQETIYPNGDICIKDKQGNVIKQTHTSLVDKPY